MADNRRGSVDEITVFKNGGGAHLDLMVAWYCLEKLAIFFNEMSPDFRAIVDPCNDSISTPNKSSVSLKIPSLTRSYWK